MAAEAGPLVWAKVLEQKSARATARGLVVSIGLAIPGTHVWPLRVQATNASTKTSAADVGLSVLVFVLAFGVGTYQLWGGSGP